MVECSSSCGAHAHHLARRLREAAEPAGDGLGRPLEGGDRLGEHLLAGPEVQGGIAPQGGQRVGQGAGADRPAGEVGELGVDAVDLGQAGAVELVRGRVQRGVRPGQAPVGRLAARQVAQAGPVRPGARPGGSPWRGPRGGGRTPGGSRRRPRPAGRSRTARAPWWSSRPSVPVLREPRRPRAGPGAASPRPGARAARPGCPPRGPRGRGRPRGRPRGTAAASPCVRPCRRAWRASDRAWRPPGPGWRPAGTHRPGAGGPGSRRAGPRSRRAARCR